MRFTLRPLLLAALLVWLPVGRPVGAEPPARPVAELPVARPGQVGMSAEKLGQVKPTLQRFVDEKKVPGAIAIVARHGKVVLFEAVGWRDIDAKKPMERDSILRFYSMTKPITSTSILMLVEAGKVKLDEPVSSYLPEFKTTKVFVKQNGDAVEVADCKREMTVRDLLRHTSGLTYGFFGNTPVDQMYRRRGILGPRDSLQTTIEKVAQTPLVFQPGTDFRYSVSTDVLGRIVERASGKTLDKFFAERVFQPLDMRDTGFHVADSARDRFANNYGPRNGKLVVTDAAGTSRYLKPPQLLSGGGGLVSTARDYMRFCQMLLNGGELNGRRLLKTETVKEMTRDQLPKDVFPIKMGGGPRQGVGFGLGFSVVAEKIKLAPHVPVGEFGWGGAASTHFWMSPKHDLAVVVLTQHQPFSFQLEFAVKPLVYAAIND